MMLELSGAKQVVKTSTKHDRGYGWLELLFTIAVVGLALQLIPNIGSVLDIRGWSRVTWIIVNAALLTVLVAVRYLPGALRAAHERRVERTNGLSEAMSREKSKDRREAIEQIRRSRNRRMY